MFSTRALLSTVVLTSAVLTFATPLTVHIEVVLDDVRAGLIQADHTDSVTATVYCNGLTTIAFPEIGYKPTVQLIEGGTNGCAYQFLPGWPHKDGSTVGKTPISASDRWPTRPASEADTLNRIGELYAHRRDAMGRDWLVMKKQPGAWLTQTAQYANLAGNPATCPRFFVDAYIAVFNNARDYIAKYGCAHAGGTEMNEANVLFEYNDANQATAHLIDWAGADCDNGNKRNAVSMARDLCADYVYYTGGPLNGCGGTFTRQQAHDICMSFDH